MPRPDPKTRQSDAIAVPSPPLSGKKLETLRARTPKHIQAALVAALGLYHPRIRAYEVPLAIKLDGARHDVPSNKYACPGVGELWTAGLLSTLGYSAALALKADGAGQ